MWSACAVGLHAGHIPKGRLCFGEKGYLNFHMARLNDANGPPSPTALDGAAKKTFDVEFARSMPRSPP